MDKIRECSAAPNDAVDFFTHMFHPVHELRLTPTAAQHHRYLAGCLAQMQRDTHAASQAQASLHVRAPDRAAGRRSLVCKAGERLLVPKVLRMIKHAAGSIARPASQHGMLFPTFPHRPRDHELPLVARPEEMDNAVLVYQGWRRRPDGGIQHRVLHVVASELPAHLLRHTAAGAFAQLPPPPAAHNQLQMQRQRSAPGLSCLVEEVDSSDGDLLAAPADPQAVVLPADRQHPLVPAPVSANPKVAAASPSHPQTSSSPKGVSADNLRSHAIECQEDEEHEVFSSHTLDFHQDEDDCNMRHATEASSCAASQKKASGRRGWGARSTGALGTLAKGYAVGGAFLGAGYLVVLACRR